MSKDIKFSTDARNSMIKGIRTLYDATRITLGPKGRNVIIEQDFGYPLITNDGVTIAKALELTDHYENMGASLIIEAASKTNDLAGDGTTTAIILASNLILEGIKKMETDQTNPVMIRKAFEEALPVMLNYIDEVSCPIKNITDLEKIAFISSGNQKIADILKEAYTIVGQDGIITIEESKTSETYLDIVRGYAFDKGYLSPYMINTNTNNSNSDKAFAELINPYILIVNQKITTMNTLVPYLEVAISKGLPLLIICSDIESEVLNTLVLNKLRGVFNCVVTKAPYYSEKQRKTLEDLALITNGIIVNNMLDDNLDKMMVLGSAGRVVVKKDTTTIIDGAASMDIINARIGEMRKQIIEENSVYEKEQLQNRIAKISGQAAVIKVGAATETELKEMYMRTEDALNATIAAQISGIIEGGGKVFYELSTKLDALNINPIIIPILKKTLSSPFFQILENAGITGKLKDEVLKEISNKTNQNIWYDASTNTYGSNTEKGIIDPASVAKTCLINAISIASLFLTTECAIVNNVDQPKEDNDLI